MGRIRHPVSPNRGERPTPMAVRVSGDRHSPGHFSLGRFPLLFCIPGHFPSPFACVAFLPESDVVDVMQVLHGCVTDVEKTDKLQTLLATCCSGWRQRLSSSHHAASAAAAVPGVHLERACRHAERRLPDEAWNRGFASLIGRNHTFVWCAIESLLDLLTWLRHAGCGRGVDDIAAECTWPAAQTHDPLDLEGRHSRRQSISRCPSRFCSVNCTPFVQQTWWLEDGERDLACSRAHSPLRVKVTVTLCWLLHYFFFFGHWLYIISPYFSGI